jgi:hypothetical protein
MNQGWAIIIAAMISAVLSSGTTIVIFLLTKSRSEMRNKRSAEIQWLTAFLEIISPDRLGNPFIDVINHRFDDIRNTVDELEKTEDWKTLISVRIKLREYFEFSGKYDDGVKFGRKYLVALDKIGEKEDAIWNRVKNIGYMLILSDKHTEGRGEIERAISLLSLAESNKYVSLNECFFYCYRYLGISYMRDENIGSEESRMGEARKCFEKAREYAEKYKGNGEKYMELSARIETNFGNLALMQLNYTEAFSKYKISHELFMKLFDKEHLGISNLKIAEALMGYSEGDNYAETKRYLRDADSVFHEIGWLEGEARVHEQFARLYKRRVEYHTNKEKKHDYLERALEHCNHSKKLFAKNHNEKAAGRLGELESAIRANL